MRRRDGILAAALAGALAAGSLQAASGDGNLQSAASSLLLPLDARAVAMGGAYVAVAGGADAMAWNPSGLNQLRAPQAELGHLSWVQGVNDEFINVAFPIYGLGAWGLGATYLYTQDEYVDMYGRDLNQSFTDFDFSLKGAFALQLPDDMAIGLEYKTLRQGYGASQSQGGEYNMGSAFDLGWQWHDVIKNLDLGAAVQNVGTPMALGTTGFNLPIDLNVGFAEHITRLTTLAFDEEYQAIDNYNFLHVGLESGLRAGDWTVFARCGYTSGPTQDQGQYAGLAAGLGAAFGSWQVDYAFAPQGDLGQSQRITLTWNGGD
jgi:hypothetical protein